jgi:hypothetical protein
MKELKINHLAVLVGIVLQFVLGFLWYGPIFGDAWMGMVGLNLEMIEADPASAGDWVHNVVSAVVSVYLLAWLFVKLKVESLSKGVLIAFLIGFGFVFLSIKSSGAFARDPYWLPWITGGYTTVGLMLAGAVLGVWKRYAN